MCGLCFYKVKDFQEQFKKEYAIDNNLVSLQDEIKVLKNKCHQNNIDFMKYESIISDLKEQLQDMRYEMNALRTENEMLKDQVKKLEDKNPKPDKKKKKKKKKKKEPEITSKQLKKLLKLMEAKEQSSSSEEEDNPCDDDGWKSDVEMVIETSSSDED